MQQILASRLFATRRGTAMLGIAAALLAGVVLIAYLNSYRDTVRATEDKVTVLVARNLIEGGTPGGVIAGKKLFQTASIAQEDVKEGALSDPAAIVDRVALADIYPGQQLTAAEFTEATTTAIPTRITGPERGISVAIDSAHGSLAHLGTGNYVDVYVGLEGSIRLLIPNVLVLSAPGAGGEGGANVVLQVKSPDAPRVAYAADNGQLWLVLRPQIGASPTKPAVVNAAKLNATKGG